MKNLTFKVPEKNNDSLDQLINKLNNTVNWAITTMNADKKELSYFLVTAIDNIYMRYKPQNNIPFSVGDVVECNYGKNFEFSGSHTISIVCNISPDGMVYLVPVSKKEPDNSLRKHISFSCPEDISYYNRNYSDGSVLLTYGKYVSTKRIINTIGTVNHQFFRTLLYELSNTFDFTHIMDFDTYDKEVTTTKRNRNGTSALVEVIGDSINKLDSPAPAEEQIRLFLSNIGMATDDQMLVDAFVVACNIPKINYENVILELHKKYPDKKETVIRKHLIQTFLNWKKAYPSLAEYPKLSFISLVKIFAKKFK